VRGGSSVVSCGLAGRPEFISLLLNILCRSTCFGRLHAHHQELTTALTASGFTLERGGSTVVSCGLAGRPAFISLLLDVLCRSTCFGRLHAHHQELTTALTASGCTLERGGSSVVSRGLAGQTTTKNAATTTLQGKTRGC
jgi:hypothetical protein